MEENKIFKIWNSELSKKSLLFSSGRLEHAESANLVLHMLIEPTTILLQNKFV